MTYKITITYEPDNSLIPAGDMDKEFVAWIVQQLKDGNDWAWCVVTVTLEFPYLGIKLSESLYECSYGSEEDFKKGGYYDDMVVSLKQRVVDACAIIVKEQLK